MEGSKCLSLPPILSAIFKLPPAAAPPDPLGYLSSASASDPLGYLSDYHPEAASKPMNPARPGPAYQPPSTALPPALRGDPAQTAINVAGGALPALAQYGGRGISAMGEGLSAIPYTGQLGPTVRQFGEQVSGLQPSFQYDPNSTAAKMSGNVANLALPMASSLNPAAAALTFGSQALGSSAQQADQNNIHGIARIANDIGQTVSAAVLAKLGSILRPGAGLIPQLAETAAKGAAYQFGSNKLAEATVGSNEPELSSVLQTAGAFAGGHALGHAIGGFMERPTEATATPAQKAIGANVSPLNWAAWVLGYEPPDRSSYAQRLPAGGTAEPSNVQQVQEAGGAGNRPVGQGGNAGVEANPTLPVRPPDQPGAIGGVGGTGGEQRASGGEQPGPGGSTPNTGVPRGKGAIPVSQQPAQSAGTGDTGIQSPATERPGRAVAAKGPAHAELFPDPDTVKWEDPAYLRQLENEHASGQSTTSPQIFEDTPEGRAKFLGRQGGAAPMVADIAKGLHEPIEKDITPTVRGAAVGAGKLLSGVQDLLGAQQGEDAQKTKALFREAGGTQGAPVSISSMTR